MVLLKYKKNEAYKEPKKRMVKMKKKIALVLIMVMLINMTAWASSSGDDDIEFGPIVIILATIGLIGLFALLLFAEDDAPDENIRLASMQSKLTYSETGFGPLLNALQRVQIGVTQNHGTFLGLRWQF
ncbi:MAG: hypothetical protein LBC80_02990 [Treponema sp.]|nr:hypothetical protein [Treponema sp.]